MAKIRVYRFEIYDITTDGMRASRRWATLEAIARVCGKPLLATEMDVDETVVGREVHGMTDLDFDPHRGPPELQTKVRS